jgi:thiamine biosynthesis lipoprotein
MIPRLPGSGDEAAATDIPVPRPGAEEAGDASGPLVTYSTSAMGCQFQIISTFAAQKELARSIHDGFDLISSLERQLTTYDSGSELEQLNQRAATQAVTVSRNLFELLCRAIEISASSHGAFDITAAPLTRLWNFHQRDGRLPAAAAIARVAGHTGYQKILLDRLATSVRFASEELRIDLGGIGKGYAIDELSKILEGRGARDFLIHGGQSSIAARGRRIAADGSDHPWQIGLTHPLVPAKRLATITIENEAVGTSGSGRQSFVHNGRRYGHIIDPRSGWPADHRLSVSVIAPDATFADAMATALFVMNDIELEAWVAANPAIRVLVFRESPGGIRIEADVFNFGERRIEWHDHSLPVRLN